MSVEVTLCKDCAYGEEGATLRVAKAALAGMLARGEVARAVAPKPKKKKKASSNKPKKAAE